MVGFKSWNYIARSSSSYLCSGKAYVCRKQAEAYPLSPKSECLLCHRKKQNILWTSFIFQLSFIFDKQIIIVSFIFPRGSDIIDNYFDISKPTFFKVIEMNHLRK